MAMGEAVAAAHEKDVSPKASLALEASYCFPCFRIPCIMGISSVQPQVEGPGIGNARVYRLCLRGVAFSPLTCCTTLLLINPPQQKIRPTYPCQNAAICFRFSLTPADVNSTPDRASERNNREKMATTKPIVRLYHYDICERVKFRILFRHELLGCVISRLTHLRSMLYMYLYIRLFLPLQPVTTLSVCALHHSSPPPPCLLKSER